MRILGFVAAFLLVLGAGELGVRMMNSAPLGIPMELTKPSGSLFLNDNPILKFGPNASFEAVLQAVPPKPKGIFRIVVLGDSVAWGSCSWDSQLDRDKIFSSLLETSLNADVRDKKKKFEVYNLSVQGYNTAQEAEYLKVQGVRLQPDLVIVAYSLNDDWGGEALDLRRIRLQNEAGLLADWLPAIFKTSALARYVWQRSSLSYFQDTKAHRTFEIPQQGFRKIKNLGEAHGFHTLVAILPVLEWEPPYPGTIKHEVVTKIAREEKVDVLDLFDSFREITEDFRTLEGRCVGNHPDENGHAVIAKALKKYLIGSQAFSIASIGSAK